MRFKNRTEAGQLLAEKLAQYKGQPGVVLPLPRGGVPLGIEIARRLDMDLDLVIPRKVGHPYSPEFAIAAVGETGEPVINQVEVARVDRQWFEQEIARQREEARRRRSLYVSGKEPIPVKDKIAILVDDGVATGLTMKAAIQDVKARQPKKIVVAIPVVPADTASVLQGMIDELVALDVDPYYLGSVGAYYEDFHQVSDEEVVSSLR